MHAAAFAPDDKGRRRYEIMIMVPGDLDEDASNESFEAIRAIMNELDGQIHQDSIWGRREMAFEINKLNHAYYGVFDVAMGHDGLVELERRLKIREDVMRFKTIRPDKHLLNV